MFQALLGEYKPTGKLSGNTLVLSLPDAITPVVWSLDLAKDGHGSISIHADEESLEYCLIYAAAKKGASPIEIARYKERAKALRALVKTTEVLEKTGPVSMAGNNGTAGQNTTYITSQHPKSLFKQIIMTIIGIVALVTLFAISTGGFDEFSKTPLGQKLSSTATISAGSETSGQNAPAAAPRANPPKDAVGIPMDADSFFGE